MNKNKYTPYILFLLFPLAVACGGKGGNTTSRENKPGKNVRYLTREVYEQESDCDTSQNDCTSIFLSYPSVVGSANQALNDTLSTQIEQWLLGAPDGERESTPEAFSKAFIEDYEQFAKDFPESPAKWFIQRRIEIIADNSRFITMQLSEENYLGGAHGMSVHLFANFDPSTARRIGLDELVREGQMDELNKTGEALFRKENNISAEQSLKEAGYFYLEDDGPGSPFHLTENFAITTEGLLFYYNPYDIAPYSMGSTILKMPFDAIGPMLKKDGVLKGLLKR